MGVVDRMTETEAGAQPGHPPFFSIVIPAYNRATIIGRALDSCLAQTFGDFEIVVVDDGSTDGTEAAIRACSDPRLTRIRQANAGGAAARNTGAAAARGRYIAFLDSDDAFLPGKLAAFHAAIEAAATEAGADAILWYSPLSFHRGEGNAMRKPDRAIRPDERVGDYLFAYDGMMQTSTLVIPKPLFDKVKFDPTLRNLQDLDLCLRLEAAGARYRMLPDEQVIWYDVAVAGRISYGIQAPQISAWADSRRALMTDKAHSGFLARYLAPRLLRSEPARALRLIGDAVRGGSLSPIRAASLLGRGLAPDAYSRVRDALVKFKSREPGAAGSNPRG